VCVPFPDLAQFLLRVATFSGFSDLQRQVTMDVSVASDAPIIVQSYGQLVTYLTVQLCSDSLVIGLTAATHSSTENHRETR
jgi:hypothetical protein